MHVLQSSRYNNLTTKPGIITVKKSQSTTTPTRGGRKRSFLCKVEGEEERSDYKLFDSPLSRSPSLYSSLARPRRLVMMKNAPYSSASFSEETAAATFSNMSKHFHYPRDPAV